MDNENHDDTGTTPEDDFDMNEYSFLSPGFRFGRATTRKSGRYVSMALRKETMRRASQQGRTAGRPDSSHHKIGLRVIATCEIHSDMTTEDWLQAHLAAAQELNVITDYKVLDEAHGVFGLRFLVFGYKAVVPAGSTEEVMTYAQAMTDDITGNATSKTLAVEA